jgi:hypothetical protein
MARVLLQVGDKVTHTTLGEGSVTVIDDEFVTIKFASDELTFRFPDAFQKGFLSSSQPIIEEIPESEEEETDEDDDTEKKLGTLPDVKPRPEKEQDNPPRKQLTRAGIWWRMFLLLLVFVPLEFFLIYSWLVDDDGVYIGFAAFFFIMGVILLAVLMNKWDKTPIDKDIQRTYDSSSRIDPATELMAGIMGAEMLHRAAERERQEAEKQRYESLYWQESIRDKNPRHDFDYDHDDDWLGTD